LDAPPRREGAAAAEAPARAEAPTVARIVRAAVPGTEPGGILPPALRAGRRLARGAVLATGPGEVVVDLGRAGRVTLGPESLARFDGPEPAVVLLARGQAHAARPPQGNGPRTPLRLGTPAGTLVLESSGEAFVLALADGRGWVAQLAGLGRARTGAEATEAESAGRPATVELTPGRALVLGADASLEGPVTLAAAEGAAAPRAQGSGSPPASAVVARTRGADRAVDTLLEAASRLAEEGARLTRMQQSYVEDDRRELAQSLQPVLVRHSQSLGRLRERLRVRAERAGTLHLLAERAESAERAARLATALGREDGALLALEAPAGGLRTSPVPRDERRGSSPRPSESAAPAGR
ncbi:MAG: hypothetical protein AAF447_27055, partial [Myxococcota bacterium]